jgi:hypothetical protein
MACAPIENKCYDHQTLKFTCRDCLCAVVTSAIHGFLTIRRDNSYVDHGTQRFRSDCKSCSKIVSGRIPGGWADLPNDRYWFTIQPDANVVSVIVSERTLASYMEEADMIRNRYPPPVRRIILKPKSKNIKNCNQPAAAPNKPCICCDGRSCGY